MSNVCLQAVARGVNIRTNTTSLIGATAVFQAEAAGHVQVPPGSNAEVLTDPDPLTQGLRKLSIGSPRSYACARKPLGMAAFGSTP